MPFWCQNLDALHQDHNHCFTGLENAPGNVVCNMHFPKKDPSKGKAGSPIRAIYSTVPDSCGQFEGHFPILVTTEFPNWSHLRLMIQCLLVVQKSYRWSLVCAHFKSLVVVMFWALPSFDTLIAWSIFVRAGSSAKLCKNKKCKVDIKNGWSGFDGWVCCAPQCNCIKPH